MSDQETGEETTRYAKPIVGQGDGSLRALTKVNKITHFNFLDHNGKIDSDEFLDCIIEIEKCFEYESKNEYKKVKITSIKLKGNS